MKNLGWIILLVSFNAFSQAVIESTPLSIEEPAGRQIIERPTGTLVPATINPEDGQLKLEPAGSSTSSSTSSEAIQIEDKKEEEKSSEAVEVEVVTAPKKENKAYQKYLGAEKFLQFSFGYLNSDYEKIDPSLDQGSMITSFRFVSDMNARFQTGFTMEVLTDNSGQDLPDSIRALQYKLFADYHAPIFPMKIDYLLGVSFSLGNFSIKRLSLNAQGEQVTTKLKSGTLIGIAPAAGLRIYLVDRNSIDLVVEYHQYFSNPQRYIGGFAFAPRFSFVF
jgi:hypothetical protein